MVGWLYLANPPIDLWKEAPPETLASRHGGTDFFVVGDIVSAIREDREPNIDVNRALDFTLPGLMSQVLIADGGRPVKVPDFRAGPGRGAGGLQNGLPGPQKWTFSKHMFNYYVLGSL